MAVRWGGVSQFGGKINQSKRFKGGGGMGKGVWEIKHSRKDHDNNAKQSQRSLLRLNPCTHTHTRISAHGE